MKPLRTGVGALFVGFLLISADSLAMTPVSRSMAPVADALVTNGPSDGPLDQWNYGGGGSLSIAGAMATRSGVTPAQRGTMESYMRFNIAQAKSDFDAAFGNDGWRVRTATLQVSQASANNPIFNENKSGTFSIDWIGNDSWVEGTGTPMLPTMDGVTYSTRPVGGTQESEGNGFSYVNPTTAATYTLPLGSALVTDIKTDTLTSLRLFATNSATSNMSFTFNSRSFNTPANRPLFTLTAVLASLGDMNGDGLLNNLDIGPFELALTDRTAYQNLYPVGNWQDRGDVNGDNAFNNFDIPQFEQMLTPGFGASVASVPEPGSTCLLITGLVMSLFFALRRYCT